MSANETTFHQIRICKSKSFKVKERPSIRSLSSHRTASYKGPKMTSVNPFKQENQQYSLFY